MCNRFIRVATIAVCLAAAAPARASFTFVQKASNGACTAASTTCSVTVTSTGSGHLLTAYAFTVGTTITVSSVSGAGTWTHPATAHGSDASGFGLDGAYNLSSSSGTTSITITVSAAPGTTWLAEVREYSFTGSSVSFDVGGNRDQSSNTTTPAGVALTLTGSNDAIVQAINPQGTCSAITTYGNLDTTSGGGACAADLLNTTSGTAPTWTQASGHAALSAMAFAEAGAVTKKCTLKLLGAGPC